MKKQMTTKLIDHDGFVWVDAKLSKTKIDKLIRSYKKTGIVLVVKK